jgi:DNA polymerase III sliding clamp (beta) subunit (PCNA family)
MKVKTSELKQALEVVKPGLVTSGVFEQSESFAFIDGSVVTFDQELSISHPIKGLEITGAIKADELYGLLSKLKAEEIDLDITETEVHVVCAKLKAGLRLYEEITLPLDQLKNKGKWKSLPEGFSKALKFAAASCSTQSSRPVLKNIHIQGDIIEASDGYRATRYKLNTGIKEMLLPASSVMKIIAINPIEYALGKEGVEDYSWVHFRNKGGTVVSCVVYAEEFPNLDKLFDVQGEPIIFPKSIVEIIDRASIFSKNPDVLSEAIQVTLRPRLLNIRAESETGWVEESAPIRYKGESFSFNIIPYLMKDILKDTQECTIGTNRIIFETEDWSYIASLLVL